MLYAIIHRCSKCNFIEVTPITKEHFEQSDWFCKRDGTLLDSFFLDDYKLGKMLGD